MGHPHRIRKGMKMQCENIEPRINVAAKVWSILPSRFGLSMMTPTLIHSMLMCDSSLEGPYEHTMCMISTKKFSKFCISIMTYFPAILTQLLSSSLQEIFMPQYASTRKLSVYFTLTRNFRTFQY